MLLWLVVGVVIRCWLVVPCAWVGVQSTFFSISITRAVGVFAVAHLIAVLAHHRFLPVLLLGSQ